MPRRTLVIIHPFRPSLLRWLLACGFEVPPQSGQLLIRRSCQMLHSSEAGWAAVRTEQVFSLLAVQGPVAVLQALCSTLDDQQVEAALAREQPAESLWRVLAPG